MNKRIKELYTKANEWALYNYPPPVNPFEWEDLRSKKFAELIVQECARVCLAQRDPANLNYKPSVKFAEAVKEHFGVEE